MHPWMTKEHWECQINDIKTYIENYGYTVVEATDEEDRVEFSEFVVYINSRNHPESRFYTMLHEYGHIDIYENAAEEFAADHPMYYRAQDGRTARSKAGRVSIMAEEIEAWKRGRWFARDAGMEIDEDKYDRHMTDALMSYINWASDG